MLMTLVTKVVNVRLFLYGAALARVNTTTTPVRVAGLNGARCEGGRPGLRCHGGSGAGPPPLAPHGPSRLGLRSLFPWCTVQGMAGAWDRAGGLCRGHGGSGGMTAAQCAGAPRRARGGLATLQRIRQRHSLCRRCPPLFSPRARGDAPVLPRLPESAAMLAWGSLASLPPLVTPGLPPCLAAAVLLPVVQAASYAGLDGQTDRWTAPPWAVPEACGQPAPEPWAGGKEGTWGGGREAKPEPGKPGREGSTPRSNHHQPPPQLPDGTGSAVAGVRLSPHRDKRRPGTLEGVGAVKRGSWSCP